MAGKKLEFPVLFDLNGAVKQATGDLDRILRQMQTQVNARPLSIRVDSKELQEFSDKLSKLSIPRTLKGDAVGSINALDEAMAKCITDWNKLAESERIVNRESGEYTDKAKQIIERFATLTAASETYAKSLSQIIAESKKAANEEIKRQQKIEQHKAKVVPLFKPDMNSLSQVEASLKNFENIAKHAKEFSSEWDFAIKKVKEMKSRSEELKETYRTMTRQNVFNMKEDTISQIKDKIKALKIQMEQAVPNSVAWNEYANQLKRLNPILDDLKRKMKEASSTRPDIAAMPEKTIADLTAKIEAYRNVMQNSDFGSKEFNQAMWAASGLTDKLDRMNRKIADREKWRTFQQAMAQAANTMDSLNQRLSAWQSRMGGLEIGSKRWLEAAENVARLSQELAHATQWAQDFQQKTFQGLSSTMTQQQVALLQNYRTALADVDRQYNELNAKKLAFDSNGNLTADAVRLLRDRADILGKIAGVTRDADAAQQTYDKKLAEEEAELKRLIEAEAKRKKHLQDALNVMQANETRIEGLNQKLQRYQQLLSKLSVGSDQWNKTALEIRRITEELARCNQRMTDFQQKAFAGLGDAFTTQQVERLTNLRRELETLDAKIHEIQQRGANGYALSTDKAQMNALLDQRIAKEKQIAEITKSASDLMLERERQVQAEIEKRKKLLDDMRTKEKAHDKAKGERTALAIAEQRRKAAGLLTKEQEKRQRMLNTEAKTINDIQKQLAYYQNKLNGQQIDSNGFVKTAKKVEELTKKLDEAQKKVDALTGKTQTGAGKQERAFNRVNEQLRKQSSYLERLTQRMMIYASVGAIGGFLTKIREVTAQFELQRISLGAIIQDQNRANQLFSEIKQFALKSPVSILNMTKYTKQVAAYRIETDKLFDTTKRLADVSVGLGVDMQRIVLAYGQTRAATYLRAAEVRQYTEAGIPMLELLAEKFTELEGKMVSTEEVMNRIKKRGVGFDMVEQIFKEMTDAGGIFYNMQEKQGNTLYGMWQKLGDAASIMYSEIGNTGWVNSSMKGLIEISTDLMRNWKASAAAGVTLASAIAVIALRNRATISGTKLKELADQKAAAATERRERAEARLDAVKKNGTLQDRLAAIAAKDKAIADENAALAAQKRAQGQNALRMGLASMGQSLLSFVGWGAALAAISTIIYKVVELIENANKLKNKIKEIGEETTVLQNQSVRHFESLVKKTLEATDGSKAQKEALDELNRTYKDMLPEEALKIENLRAMKGNYDELTQAVREYIAAQQEQKAINEVNEYEGAIQVKMRRKLGEVMKDKDRGSLALTDDELRDFFDAFNETIFDESKNIKEQFVEAFRIAGLEGAEEMWEQVRDQEKDWIHWSLFAKMGFTNDDRYAEVFGTIGEYKRSVKDQAELLQSVTDTIGKQTGQLGEYTKDMKEYQEYVKQWSNSGETFLQNQQNVDMQISKMEEKIRTAMEAAGIAWQEGWSDIIKEVDPNDLNHLSSLNMEAIIAAIDPKKHNQLWNYVDAYRKMYYSLVPQDTTVQQIRAKMFQIAESTGAGMEAMRRFLWDGSGDVDAHLKYLNEQIEQYEASLKKMQTTVINNGILGTIANLFLGGKIKETQAILDALKQQAEFVKTYTIQKDKGGGSKNDTRLSELQEIQQTLEKINKEYNDLSKREGKVAALTDIRKQFEDTLKYTNKLGKKFGLAFDYPTEFANLQKYREEILKVMKSLKNLKGGDKAILEFETMIAKADSDEMQRQLDEMLKDLQEKMKRTKTAKEFFEKILEQTGDEELAIRITYSIYPETGKDLYTDMQNEIRQIFRTGDVTKDNALKIRLDAVLDDENERINYRELDRVYAEYQNDIIEKNRDTARKLIAEGQKTAAAQVAEWEKMYAKSKSFEEQRTDIINRETAERSKIYKSNLPQDVKERLTEQSRQKQSEDISKLNYEEFTKSEDYVKIFENLGNVSTKALKRLRSEMEKLIATNKDLSPENMKALVKAMENIDGEISGRGFGNDMIKSVNDYAAALRNLKTAKADLKTAQAEYDEQLPQLDADIESAKADEIAAQEALNALLADELADKNAIVSAQLRLNNAVTGVEKAEQKKADAAKKVQKAEQKVTDEQDAQKKATSKFFKDLQKVSQTASDLAGVIGEVKDLLGIAADSAAGVAFDSAIEGLETFSKSMNLIIGLQELYNVVTSSNPWMAIAAAVLAVGSILGSWISNNKVRKANKEIEKQQKILDQLSYTYDRLQVAADKLFGADWLSNFNQQEKALKAEAAAYGKQAEAERSKGKKADEEKIKQYEESARDCLDQIADMYGTVAEKMLGADLASTARDFAQAWLDAYKEFGSTADAMGEKFKEMVENMVVEGALARVMERALKPMFDMIDNMDESDFYSQSFWSRVVAEAEKGADAANYGAGTMMKFLEQARINLRELGGELTGISREVGSATSEEISLWGAALNTQNFYIQQTLENVRAIRAVVEGGLNIPSSSSAIDYTAIQNAALDHMAAIERHTAETVSECRNIVAKCEEQTTLLRRVIVSKGAKQVVNVAMNY